MIKRLEEYVKYTTHELDSYVSTPGSCVHKINLNRHYALDPYVLSNIKKALPAYILKNEVSYYEAKLQGVLLAIKNIKVLEGVAALRTDDPHLHINTNADCYIFRPEVGAELSGVVKHIGKQHLGVILYRVFNAKINFQQQIAKEQLTLGQDLKFRIRKFGVNGIFVNIHGELLKPAGIESEPTTTKKAKRIAFAKEEKDNATTDSGIEEENKLTELDELLDLIKNETVSEDETTLPKAKPKKRKQNTKLDSSSNENVGKKHIRKSIETSLHSETIKTEIVKKIKKENHD